MFLKTKYYDSKYLEEKMKLFNKNELLTTLLLNREKYTKEDVDLFLNPNYKNLNDPYLIDNMEEVSNKIIKYRNTNKKIMIFGDYDIDGISGSLYLSKILNNLGIINDIYIPNRQLFKYSLDDEFYKNILKYDLIISVDNSFGEEIEINKLLNLGIELIITDHHLNNKELNGILEINPQKSSNYPFKELSGAGVVFKLAQALYDKSTDREVFELYEYSELIALATIADVMDTSNENRFLIKRGLKNFAKTKILAFDIIMKNFKIEPKYINVNDISYRISPLINAISKLNDPSKIIKFLKSNSEKEILNILNEMYDYNSERKKYENNLYNKIINFLKLNNLKNIKYIYYEINDINLGVLGSISSKLAMEYKVPVIIISRINNYCKASCRSVNDKNIYNIIKKFEKYFINYGGHELAAGFLISNDNLNKIKSKLKTELYYLNKSGIRIKNEIIVDKIYRLSELNLKEMKKINRLSPYGLSNPEPVFFDYKIRISNITIFGLNNNHFKANIKIKGKYIQVIGYNLSHKLKLNMPSRLYKIMYTPELINKKIIIIKLKDIE